MKKVVQFLQANPELEVFYLENPHGVIADFPGNPPYEF